MLLDFIAVFCVGGGVAGIVLLLRKIFKDRMPKWTLPAAIGAGMLIFSIWNEYTWFDRSISAQPESTTLLLAPRDVSPIRPWTYLIPPVSRYLALDGSTMFTSKVDPAFRQADLMFVERWVGTKRLSVAIDCKSLRRADLTEGAILSPEGVLTGSSWIAATVDDPLLVAACDAT